MVYIVIIFLLFLTTKFYEINASGDNLIGTDYSIIVVNSTLKVIVSSLNESSPYTYEKH